MVKESTIMTIAFLASILHSLTRKTTTFEFGGSKKQKFNLNRKFLLSNNMKIN